MEEINNNKDVLVKLLDPETEEQKKKRESDEFKNSVDYIKDLLGMSEEK